MSERDTRRKIATEAPLNPLSLVGSWALYQGAGVKQALVVGEVQAGAYMLEFYDLFNDQPTHQELWSLPELMRVDADGGTWKFYDTEHELRQAMLGAQAAVAAR